MLHLMKLKYQSCKFILLTLCFIGMVACRNAKNGSDQNSNFDQLASERLQGTIDCLENEAGTFVLCTGKSKLESGPGTKINYLIIDKANNKVLIEDVVTNGHVKWYSDSEISILRNPGMMGEGQTKDDYTFIYNLKTNEKVRKSELD